MAPSCWFFWAWWLPLMVAGAVADQQAQGCSGSAKRCGNLTISDPFWLVDLEKGKSCGAPGFEVFCEKNTPSLQSPGRFGFTIINITYEKHNLRAIDKGKLELMQASNTCHIPHSRNTSVKLRPPFRISPANLDLVMYNCKEEVAGARQDGALVHTRMRCRNESEVFSAWQGVTMR
nr:uncharacterized protein LOC127341126 [Lolium perenne]